MVVKPDAVVLRAKLFELRDLMDTLKAKLPELSSATSEVRAEEERTLAILQAMHDARFSEALRLVEPRRASLKRSPRVSAEGDRFRGTWTRREAITQRGRPPRRT